MKPTHILRIFLKWKKKKVEIYVEEDRKIKTFRLKYNFGSYTLGHYNLYISNRWILLVVFSINFKINKKKTLLTCYILVIKRLNFRIFLLNHL